MIPLSGITQILTSCLIHILILSYIAVTLGNICLYLILRRIFHPKPADCLFLDRADINIRSNLTVICIVIFLQLGKLRLQNCNIFHTRRDF